MEYVTTATVVAFILGAIVGYWYRAHPVATWRK